MEEFCFFCPTHKYSCNDIPTYIVSIYFGRYDLSINQEMFDKHEKMSLFFDILENMCFTDM